MLRIFLGGAMSNLGSTKIFVDKAQWNNRTSRQKGRSSEALTVNASLDAISANLHSLYHKYQDDQTISLDKLRSAYLGQIQEFSTFLPVFDKFIDDIRQRVGHTISKESLQKYSVLRKHFFEFLVHRYKRKDIGLMEFTPAIIQDFELYLTTVALCTSPTKGSRFMSLCIWTWQYDMLRMPGTNIALLRWIFLRPQLRTGNQVLWELNQGLKELQKAQASQIEDSVTIRARQAIRRLSSPTFTRRGIKYLIPLV